MAVFRIGRNANFGSVVSRTLARNPRSQERLIPGSTGLPISAWRKSNFCSQVRLWSGRFPDRTGSQFRPGVSLTSARNSALRSGRFFGGCQFRPGDKSSFFLHAPAFFEKWPFLDLTCCQFRPMLSRVINDYLRQLRGIKMY